MRITPSYALVCTLVCLGCGDDGGGTPGTSGGSTTDDATGDSAPASSASTSTTATTAATSTTTEGTTEGTTMGPGTSTSDETTGQTGSTSASTGEPDTGSSSGGSVSTSTGESESSSSTSGGEAAQFPPPETFGDSVLETDLVGQWALQWTAEKGNLVLDVQPSGAFRLTEYDTACSVVTLGQGSLWVSGYAIVFHFDDWSGQALWPTESTLGYELNPPFRMSSSFTLQGSEDDAFLAIVAPETLLADDSYAGQSFLRLTTEGAYLGGQWQGEASLQMLVPGEEEPVLAVIDSQKAFLDVELVGGTPEGTGTWARDRTWYPTPLLESIYANFNWTCLDGCPSPAGTTFVAGTNLYTYGPYAGQSQLMPLQDGRAFQRGVAHGCE